MAYATIAGLPVQVGLYTALVPMVIYALLGTSRPLSVSTTTTIAILTAAALGARRAGRRAAGRMIVAARDARGAGRRDARARLGAAARLRRQLHLRARADRLQVGHRPRDRRRPDPEAARHPYRQGRLPPRPRWRSSQHLPRDVSIATLAIVGRRSRADLRARALRAARACAADRGRRGASPRRGLLGSAERTASRRSAPSRAGCRAWYGRELGLVAQLWPAAAGIALMSFTETHRGRRAPSPRRTSRARVANRELLAIGARERRRRALRRDAGGRRHVADRGQPQRGRAHAVGRARHRRHRARDAAAARAGDRADAAGGARGRRGRLLDRADQAGGVPSDPRVRRQSSAGRSPRSSA